MKYIIFAVLIFSTASQTYAQNKLIKGKIIDNVTKEALFGAVIFDNNNHSALSDAAGNFSINTSNETINVTFNNYQPKSISTLNNGIIVIALAPDYTKLEQVIVSASRTSQKRSEAPVAISTINLQTIKDTKATQIDQLLNKVSGVFMVDLSNEQHEMSIRQPMTTRSLFLYLEDGIPIRTTGIYNHNALLEMNLAATKSIEIIKGPASSLYGAEAIGGAVNVITKAPPAVFSGMASVQANNNGYKKIDAQVGNTSGKFGWIASGYFANRNDGPIPQTNYHKTAFTLRGDYKINDKTTWSNSITYVDYYSDMGGGSLDSTHFAKKDYNTLYTFNYRKVNALRIKSQLIHQWNSNAETQVSLAYRTNSVKQNPSYYVANNLTNSLLANGQVNNSSFISYLFIAQHVQKFNLLKSKLIAGVSSDISPSTYVANFIKIQRDAVGKYASFNNIDSALSNYKTGISNVATYINYELSPIKRLKIVAALRYDFYHYNFQNYLPPSASSGAPSTKNDFNKITPKIGATYNYKQAGFYTNYSQGYVPPQVTELFNSVKVPYLNAQTFYNYEVGGWISLLKNKLYADYSLYLLKGTNEIISVRQTDGSYVNQNAGKTKHQGIEYGVTYTLNTQWMFRISATNAKHTFIQDIEKGIDYSGNEMAAAPHFTTNTEIGYKPSWVKGLRLSAEWQHQGTYYLDNANSGKYNGFDIFNFRAGYTICKFEIWANTLNAFNKYYSNLASKSTYGYIYQLGNPREITLGIEYNFGR